MTEAIEKERSAVQEPIYVELEGALVRGDLFWESVFAFLGDKASHLFKLAAWLLQGPEQARRRILESVDLDVSLLPYDEDFLLDLKEQKARGKQLVLVTRTNSRYAEPVARHLGIFHQVLPGSGPSARYGRGVHSRVGRCDPAAPRVR